MKCKCGNEFSIKLGAKTEGCKVLTSMTTIVTVQCASCNAIFQLPLQSDAIFVEQDRTKEKK